jgi:CheY-like chemotaxis protein
MPPRDHPIALWRRPGAGGRFKLVPAIPERLPLTEQTTVSGLLRRRHIVAVDDAPDIRALLTDLLQGEGYRVSTLATLPTMRELAAMAPDLIVLDLLYHGDYVGLPFIATLRADPALRTVPLVICTGATDAVERAEPAFATHDVGVVLKPFDIETLLAEIARRLYPAD